MLIFKEWAYWAISSPAQDWTLGFKSASVESAIQDGKGKILPGPPRRSGRPSSEYTPRVRKVDQFLRGRSRKVILVYFAYDGTFAEKATLLGISRRQMTRQVTNIYEEFLNSAIYKSPEKV